jgi:hypothetical protein
VRDQGSERRLARQGDHEDLSRAPGASG